MSTINLEPDLPVRVGDPELDLVDACDGGVQFRRVIAVALDHVADINDKLGLKKIELAHRKFEGALDVVTPGPIADDGELKILRSVV